MPTNEESGAPVSALVDWKRLFTGLLGVGIVALIGFFVTAWNVSDNVSTVAKRVESLATKEEVAQGDAQVLKEANRHTENRVGELLRKTDSNTQSLKTISEDIREMKADQRRENAESADALREISREIKRIQIEQAGR